MYCYRGSRHHKISIGYLCFWHSFEFVRSCFKCRLFIVKIFSSYFGFYIENVITDGQPYEHQVFVLYFRVFFVLYCSCILSSSYFKCTFNFTLVSPCLSVCLFICVPLSLSVRLFIYLCLCRFVFQSLFNGQFALVLNRTFEYWGL